MSNGNNNGSEAGSRWQKKQLCGNNCNNGGSEMDGDGDDANENYDVDDNDDTNGMAAMRWQ